MDIRTKLALALVSVALASMLLLGTFAFRVSAGMLQDITERQLDALAETKKQDLENVIESWRNQVRLIRSRTQLRIQLKHYQESRDDDILVEMQRIVADAEESTAEVKRIAIFGTDHQLLLSAGDAEPVAVAAADIGDEEVAFAGFVLGANGRPQVVFNSAMELDGERIGSLEVVIDVADLEALADNYRGLGETGETMVVGHNRDGTLVLLHTLRHTGDAPDWSPPPEYVRAALAGVEQIFTERVEDYRGESVWAATRYLPDINWGLIVKVDAEEEMARVGDLRQDMIDLALALGAFAVTGGTLLGFYLARPIRDLADVVRRIRHGERDLRCDATSEDEIGLLAETLNEYLDQVQSKQEKPPDSHGIS